MNYKTYVIILLIIFVGLTGCITDTNVDLKIPHPPPDPFENEKLGSALNYTAYLYETQGIDAARSFIAAQNTILEGNSISSRIVVNESNPLNLDVLTSLGIKVKYVDGNTIFAWIPIQKIHDIGALEFVKIVYLDANPVAEYRVE